MGRCASGGRRARSARRSSCAPSRTTTSPARIQDLTTQGSQFLIATHSPILLALPGARILEIGDDGDLRPVPYDDALPVRTTRDFLADPARTLRHLLG
ncbi:hypothetical protein GCM10010472_18760 [Pseudonocardia halophobica]|uniref:ATPase AAA-type core domain-containing protein n=1 Tax=Pseudonocardia halophobica TaxID=29401 RepID=A0A9W6NU31_9PSEU|nr:hypothetical protein [Pseudonocardia halophobica]GLL09910.1 hypothetical protein GCM10017577_10500 [Pseudonocardia halophobica]